MCSAPAARAWISLSPASVRFTGAARRRLASSQENCFNPRVFLAWAQLLSGNDSKKQRDFLEDQDFKKQGSRSTGNTIIASTRLESSRRLAVPTPQTDDPPRPSSQIPGNTKLLDAIRKANLKIVRFCHALREPERVERLRSNIPSLRHFEGSSTGGACYRLQF